MTAKKQTPTARVLRVNAYTTPDRIAPAQGTAVPSSMRRRLGTAQAKRPRREGEAGSVSYSTLHDPGVYRTGMGEAPTVNRPGSEIAHQLPSKGLAT
jgi:hypothetical protein